MEWVNADRYYDQLKRIWDRHAIPESKISNLAPLIKDISDHFTRQSMRSTPWQKENLVAYASYFGLMNYIRVQHCLSRILTKSPGINLHFKNVYEWGSGLGASYSALSDHIKAENWNFFESSQIAQDFHRSSLLNHQTPPQKGEQSEPNQGFRTPQFNWQVNAIHQKIKENSLFFSCYALNEQVPNFEWKQFDALLILEPSTYDFSQKLIQFRQLRIEDGFVVHSPCTHQQQCPMSGLNNFWCHDRAHWRRPSWFQSIEQRIGIQSATLPYSYLFMVRPHVLSDLTNEETRVVGDELIEKGKTRWSICDQAGLRRMAFMHRHGKSPNIKRGDLVNLNSLHATVKGDEIRIQPSAQE